MDSSNNEKMNDFLESTARAVVAKNKYTEYKTAVIEHDQSKVQELFYIIDNEIFGEYKDAFLETLGRGSLLYRARIIEPKDYPCYETKDSGANELEVVVTEKGHFQTMGFNSHNSMEPPLGLSSQGRNNKPGVSYLYAAEDVETACSEVKASPHSLISVATLEVKTPLRIVNFSDDKAFAVKSSKKLGWSLSHFFTLLMSDYTVPVVDPEKYYFTQVVSDYIRKTGVDGISYASFYSEKRNYTVFNSHPSKIAFRDSKIVKVLVPKQYFVDYNENMILEARADEGEYSIEKIKKDWPYLHLAFNKAIRG